MKKRILFLLLLAVLLCLPLQAGAQEEERTENLMEKFPHLKYRDFCYQNQPRKYYRFPTYVPFFDPLDLKYFPHETWNQEDWSLLERWEDTWTYHQMIMLRKPAQSWIFHGEDVGKDYGFLNDFYLYATLFVADDYPVGGGSCYVYYSDSLLKGFGSSTGILVDPQRGVFRVDNTYGTSYNLTNKNHELTIIKAFNPEDYPISEDNIAASSYGTRDFRYEIMDEHFAKDWKAVRNESHMPNSTVRAYRVELIREGTDLRIYINGKLAATVDDGITKTDASGEVVPEMVSWSFGPMLYTEGETVTCATGDFYVFGKTK